MKIILVEDDFQQSQSVADVLARSFSDAKIVQIATEQDFMAALPEWQVNPPDLFIFDLMLPWAFVGDAEVIAKPEGDFRTAGVRCAKAALVETGTKNVPMIIHSIVTADVIRDALGVSPSNLAIMSKDSSISNLVLMVRSLIQATSSGALRSFGKDIFVVHGHDDEAKETVARFIEKLGGRAVILHEQPNAGRTIIEKFEHHSNVAFAIVLLTPDDVGGKSAKTLKQRARQNVVFELGFFFAKLGRNKVCALHKEDVEIPSDIQGVIYTPMDKAGAWRIALMRELKAAGIPLDYDKAI